MQSIHRIPQRVLPGGIDDQLLEHIHVDFPDTLKNSMRSLKKGLTDWAEHGNARDKQADQYHSPKGGGRGDRCETNRCVMTRTLMESTPFIWGEREKAEEERLSKCRGPHWCDLCQEYGHHAWSKECGWYHRALQNMDAVALEEHQSKSAHLPYAPKRGDCFQRCDPPLQHMVCGLTRAEDVNVIMPLLCPLWCIAIEDAENVQELFETPFVSAVHFVMQHKKQTVAWAQWDHQATMKVKEGVVTFAFLGVGLRMKLVVSLTAVAVRCGADWKNGAMEVVMTMHDAVQKREQQALVSGTGTKATYEDVTCVFEDGGSLNFRLDRIKGERMVVWLQDHGCIVQCDAAVSAAIARYVVVRDMKRKRAAPEDSNGEGHADHAGEDGDQGQDAECHDGSAGASLVSDGTFEQCAELDPPALEEPVAVADEVQQPAASEDNNDGEGKEDAQPSKRRKIGPTWEPVSGLTCIMHVWPLADAEHSMHIYVLREQKWGRHGKHCGKLQHCGLQTNKNGTCTYQMCTAAQMCVDCQKDSGKTVLEVNQDALSLVNASADQGDDMEVWWRFTPESCEVEGDTGAVKLKAQGAVLCAVRAFVNACLTTYGFHRKTLFVNATSKPIKFKGRNLFQKAILCS